MASSDLEICTLCRCPYRRGFSSSHSQCCAGAPITAISSLPPSTAPPASTIETSGFSFNSVHRAVGIVHSRLLNQTQTDLVSDNDIVLQDIKAIIPKCYWTMEGDGFHQKGSDFLMSHLRSQFPGHPNHHELLREVFQLKQLVLSLLRDMARNDAVIVVNKQRLTDEFGNVVTCNNLDEVKKATNYRRFQQV
jgi:hypothetical protein